MQLRWNLCGHGVTSHTPPRNLSTHKCEKTLGRAPQKNPFAMRIQQTKILCQKQIERNTIKTFLAQHKIQGIGKKDLCSNGKQQDIGQENWVLKRYQINYRNSSLINKN